MTPNELEKIRDVLAAALHVEAGRLTVEELFHSMDWYKPQVLLDIKLDGQDLTPDQETTMRERLAKGVRSR